MKILRNCFNDFFEPIINRKTRWWFIAAAIAIGLLFLASAGYPQTPPQDNSLTVEKLAEKFVQEHAPEAARCLVMRIDRDQLIDQRDKLIVERDALKKQIQDMVAKEAKK